MRMAFVVSEDENLGVEYLSSALKGRGHRVDLVFNPQQFNKAYARIGFLARLFDWEELNLRELEKINPDMVGFSCVTANYQWAVSFARKVKERLKKPIIFGGVHPTLKPELVMENPWIDMACVGEGEEALPELLDSIERGENRTDVKNIWFRRGGGVVKNEPRPLEEDIDKYEMDRKLFFDKLPANYRKSAYYIASRGCPYNCAFCGNEQKRKIYLHKGKFLRRKSVGRALRELEDLKALGAGRVLFVDDVLTTDKKWFAEFMEGYGEKIKLPFTCFIHPRGFDEETARLLAKGGCKLIWYGVQSGSEKVRREILNRNETNGEIKRAAEICRRFNLKYMVDHIFDIPFDDDITESIRLYNEIRPHMLNCYNLLYFPSARIIDHALRAKMLTADDVKRIDEGADVGYQTGICFGRAEGRSNYGKYALFLTLIPLMPRALVGALARRPRALNLFGRLPLFTVPLVKTALNFRVGHGFIPLAVLNTELFWIRKLIRSKLFAGKGFIRPGPGGKCTTSN